MWLILMLTNAVINATFITPLPVIDSFKCSVFKLY